MRLHPDQALDRLITAQACRRQLLVLAGVAIASGLLLDVMPGSAKNGRFDALDLAPIGCYATGLVLEVKWAF